MAQGPACISSDGILMPVVGSRSRIAAPDAVCKAAERNLTSKTAVAGLQVFSVPAVRDPNLYANLGIARRYGRNLHPAETRETGEGRLWRRGIRQSGRGEITGR